MAGDSGRDHLDLTPRIAVFGFGDIDSAGSHLVQNEQLSRALGKFLALGAGSGLLLGGLRGLIAQKHRANPEKTRLAPRPISLAVPAQSSEEEPQSKAAAYRSKRAGFPGEGTISNWLQGGYSHGLAEDPRFWAAAIPLGAGGLVLGNSLVEKLLSSQRKREVDDDLAAARAEYEAALQPAGVKTASEMGRDLDTLWEAATGSRDAANREKTAFFGPLVDAVRSTSMTLPAASLGLVPAATLLSAAAFYDRFENSKREKSLRRALKKWRNQKKQPLSVVVPPGPKETPQLTGTSEVSADSE